jgi:hypothetical protein
VQYFLNAEVIHENDDFLENLIWTANTYHKYARTHLLACLTEHSADVCVVCCVCAGSATTTRPRSTTPRRPR